MDTALAESTWEALTTDWILDCDTTVKLLYGHQEGAEVGYNPTKPGRPSQGGYTTHDLETALQPLGTGGGVDLQLVELVCEAGSSADPA